MSYSDLTSTFSYKSLLTWQNLSALAGNDAMFVSSYPVGGRLTLESGVPISTTDQSAKGTIYFTPYKGNKISLYDGTNWIIVSFAETSLAVPATGTKMHDVFAYSNSGVLALEALAWTNDTTRATALTTSSGVLVKSGDATRRYLGSFRTITASQCSDTLALRHLWNYYNRVVKPMKAVDATSTWTYTTATYREANNATTNRLQYVVGVEEDEIQCRVSSACRNTSAGVGFLTGIGIDSTTVNSAQLFDYVSSKTIGGYELLGAEYKGYVGIGFHFLSWLEKSDASGTTTWAGTEGSCQHGIHGELLG